jgi:hypothetical protein
VIEFLDAASGAPADVGAVRFELAMDMPGMAMHAGSSIERAPGVGRYRATIKPEMAGDWTARLRYAGPHGSGELGFTLNVKP